MKAGRELDCLVATKIMGYEQFNCEYTGTSMWRYPDGTECAETETFFNSIAFSTDISVAWQVVEKLQLDGWNWMGQWFNGKDPAYSTFQRVEKKGGSSFADSISEAICLAALAVVEEGVPA